MKFSHNDNTMSQHQQNAMDKLKRDQNRIMERSSNDTNDGLTHSSSDKFEAQQTIQTFTQAIEKSLVGLSEWLAKGDQFAKANAPLDLSPETLLRAAENVPAEQSSEISILGNPHSQMERKRLNWGKLEEKLESFQEALFAQIENATARWDKIERAFDHYHESSSHLGLLKKDQDLDPIYHYFMCNVNEKAMDNFYGKDKEMRDFFKRSIEAFHLWADEIDNYIDKKNTIRANLEREFQDHLKFWERVENKYEHIIRQILNNEHHREHQGLKEMWSRRQKFAIEPFRQAMEHEDFSTARSCLHQMLFYHERRFAADANKSLYYHAKDIFE